METMMEERIKRLKKWAKNKPQGPTSIHLDPTNRCNLKCKFCWQRSHERMGLVDLNNELPEEKLLQLVEEASKLKVEEWLISGGGEPLVRYETTIKIMKKIKEKKMNGDIITNGTLFQEKDIKDLVKLGWDRVRFSINGPDAKTHDYLVNKKGSFEKSIRAFQLFNEYKKKFKTEKPELGFNTVINSKNYDKFPQIIKLLYSLGGELINTQTIILYSNKEKKWALNKKQRKEFKRYVKEALRIAKKFNIKTNLKEYLNEELVETSNKVSQMKKVIKKDISNRKNDFSEASCFEPWYLITIRANGIVGSCRLFGDQGTSLHNKSLKGVWFGEYFNKARQRILRQDVPDYCQNCGANEFVENKKIRDELKKEQKRFLSFSFA